MWFNVLDIIIQGSSVVGADKDVGIYTQRA